MAWPRNLLLLVVCASCCEHAHTTDAHCVGGDDSRCGELAMDSASLLQHRIEGALPCQCETSNPSWVRSTRTRPKCVFFDLGANKGNTFTGAHSFLNDSFTTVANCPGGGSWYALLVEANPLFDKPLRALQQQYGEQQVLSLSSTAAYGCEGTTSFYLDTVDKRNSFAGSSMSTGARAVKWGGGKKQITVPTVNVNKLLFENTIPEDTVIVKMDVEGAEWDIIPCLAQSPSSRLVDHLFVEMHGEKYGVAGGLSGTTAADVEAAKQTLRKQGTNIPSNYNSRT